MNTRPMSAGLNTLRPKPPNTILPKNIANTAPTTAIQIGMVGGRLRASSVPVTNTAEVTGSFGTG